MRCSIILLSLLITILASCAAPVPPIYPTPDPYGTRTPDWHTPSGTLPADIVTATETHGIIETPNHDTVYAFTGYTHQQADGNRFVPGAGSIPELTPLAIPLPGPASWVVAIPWGAGSFWAVTLDDGQVLGFRVTAQVWESVPITPGKLEAGQPPLLLGNGTQPSLLMPPSILASPLTHAIPITGPHYSQIFIDTDGNLRRVDPNLRQSPLLKLNALPDARILSDERGRLLLLTRATDQYDHGVLGDALEASSFTLINDLVQGEYTTLSMPDGLVIEGIAPIWADLDGDGSREIIVTVSNAVQGAQILVFSEAGEWVAAGPAIGQGYRWRHQLAAAPFGPNGELELVDVLTPHLSGVVEFFRWEGDQLRVVAQLPGYTSHVIGTRNLDMAAAGDFDADGRIELLLPRQDRSELGAIRRTEGGAEVVWSLPLSGRLTTNIGAVTLSDGSIAVGVGLENDILTIWHP